MSSVKGTPGPFDGMERAQEGEPVFTLRAHDPLAARLVKVWVWVRRRAIRAAFAKGDINEEKRDLELVQCREAEEIAFSMDEWRAGVEGSAAAVAGKANPASYLGNDRTERDLEAQRLWQARKRLEKECANAEAEILEAAAALSPWGFGSVRRKAQRAVAVVRATRELVAKAGYSVADLDKEWD